MINDTRSTSPHIDRRRLLGLGLGLGAVATPLISGCRTEPRGATGTVAQPGEFKPPTFIPPDNIEGASVSDIEGVPPAYTRYPAEPQKSVQKVPGSGGEVSTFQVFEQAPPPKNNPWLKQFDERLGVTLKPTYAAGPSYGQKVQTLMASGDLPDITWVERSIAPGIIKPLLQGAFTDLTDILSGSGIEAYPNLARIPTYAWRNSTVNGKILGVPGALPLVNQVTMYRKDWATELGHPEPPKNADEMLEMLVAFNKGKHRNNRKQETWGLASLGHGIGLAHQMFRVPNEWRLQADGSLVHEIETDEYEAATEYLVRLWKSGAFHPDAATLPVLDAQSMYQDGRFGLLPAGFTPHYRTMMPALLANDPESQPTPITPPGHDGGDPIVHQEQGYFGIAAIPSSVGKDAKKVEELLRVIDYWCAPFGSEEHTFINYGIEGRHFDFDDKGTPVPAKGDLYAREVSGPSWLVSPREAAFFFPGNLSWGVDAQQAAEAAVPKSVENPTFNLISDTDVRQSAALDQMSNDYLYGIITGRRPMSEMKKWRNEWRKAGGDAIRAEYEKVM